MVEEYVTKEGSFSNCYIDMIMQFTELILIEHYLKFNNVYYKQIQGTAMGSNFAVVYACIFLCHLKRKVAEKICLKNLKIFKRYIDDAFGVWSGTIEELKVYFRTYSKIYPTNIKITTSVSISAVNILDIEFYKDVDFVETGVFTTRFYQKELNAYQYIPFSSGHPHHQKESFIISELRRFLVREKDPYGFINLRNLFYKRLRARGYPRNFLLHCFNKVSVGDRGELLNKYCSKTIKTGKRAPLVMKLDFCKRSKNLNLGDTLNPKLLELLHKDPALPHILKPLICWRNPKKLGSVLTWYKFSLDSFKRLQLVKKEGRRRILGHPIAFQEKTAS
eukprot:Gb_02531 [translate_table: standard]